MKNCKNKQLIDGLNPKSIYPEFIIWITRMHSSMMRTVRCIYHLGRRVSGQGGVCPGGLPRWVSVQEGGLPGGDVCRHPSCTEFSTDVCENITFPQLLLRTVRDVLLGFVLCFQQVTFKILQTIPYKSHQLSGITLHYCTWFCSVMNGS